MAEVTYMTREGYNKLKAELEHMRAKERPAAAAAIAEARDKGDLSELLRVTVSSSSPMLIR